MSTFFSLLFKSLETGSVYALASLGIVLIFRTSKTTNFAQGVIGTFNAYLAALIMIHLNQNIWLATIVALASAFLTGIVIDRVVIRPAHKVGIVSKQIITLGLIMVILGLIPMIFGVDPLRLPRFIPINDQTQFHLLGATVGYNTVFVISLSLAFMGLLFWFLMRTKWGLAIRVTASNEETSKLMGIPTKTITMGSWATAAMLGTLAAIIVAPNASVNPLMMTDVQVNAFFAGVLGGFTSFIGPVIGAYIIAFSKTIMQFYVSSEWGNVIVYTLILILLYLKPQGLFGKKEVKKV